MTSDFGAAKSSDLYTGELPSGLDGREAPETLDLTVLDARIEAAQAEMESASGELTELLTPQAEETGGSVLGNLARFCDQATEGIARFFSSLFGSHELPVTRRDVVVAQVLERLNMRQEHLQELQDLRSDLSEVRVRIRELQDGSPETLLPQAQQLRTELSPISDLLKELSFPPVTPGDSSTTSLIDRLAIVETLPFSIRDVDEARAVVVGDPEGDAVYWHEQNGSMTCAIVDQEMILDKMAGNPSAVNEFDLLQEAVASGRARWDGATSPHHIGYLIEKRGIPIETVAHEAVSRLAERLADGQEAIVGVRGEVIWGVEPVQSGSDVNPANHAIWVTGARVIERGGLTEVASLYINDSGDPNGRGREIPVEQFLRAWSASDNRVVYIPPVQR
jgi:hypothetical protein